MRKMIATAFAAIAVGAAVFAAAAPNVMYHSGPIAAPNVMFHSGPDVMFHS